MKRHAYLIMAHSDWKLFNKLLKCLDDSRNALYVHIDKKASFIQSEIYNPQKATCTYIKRRKVSWGGYSQVATEIDLLEASTSQGFDYYHLISGQDLPIKDQDSIHVFFDKQNSKYSFVGFSPSEVYSELALERLGQYHFLQDTIGRNPGKWIHIMSQLEERSLAFQKMLKINRIADYPFKIYKGTSWFSINHELAQYIVTRKKDIQKYFKYSKCADELFLQTIAQESPYKDSIIHSTLREIDWERGQPYTYTKEDFSLLMESENLFARKFGTSVDSDIIDMICDRVSC